MSSDDLDRQLSFLREIDQLKGVFRQSPLLDRSRRENSAEHSWHVAMYAMLLYKYAAALVDASRVIQMLLIHDIVEVDAGDHPLHLSGPDSRQAELESQAAERLFGLLPAEQKGEMLELWREFEAGESDDAKFAKALDRFQPLVANVVTGGGTWAQNRVTLEQVRVRYGTTIQRGAPELWKLCERWIEEYFSRAGEAERSD
ncbi:HD domain-containing protein [Lacipirellula sp.]|uniref:HD domain-containing protein n=1 Tax=Lacipirellula sp. TaxID=2691419 RepID=UPI003D107A16